MLWEICGRMVINWVFKQTVKPRPPFHLTHQDLWDLPLRTMHPLLLSSVCSNVPRMLAATVFNSPGSSAHSVCFVSFRTQPGCFWPRNPKTSLACGFTLLFLPCSSSVNGTQTPLGTSLIPVSFPFFARRILIVFLVISAFSLLFPGSQSFRYTLGSEAWVGTEFADV